MQAPRVLRCFILPLFEQEPDRRRLLLWSTAWILAPLLILFAFPRRTLAQSPEQEDVHEIVANLCAGRVIVGVAKDGIVVATLENPIEPETRPPMIVPISEDRVAVVLGAADWWLPDEQRELARIDKELPELPAKPGLRTAPHLQASAQEGTGSEATDIEQLADRLRARLSVIADQIHGNLKLDPGDPILEIVLADYAPDYGAEVWLIQYSIEQEPEQGDFWTTRVLQPQYTQLWPPEKGQPRGLIEVSYPAEPPIGTMIRSGDARVAQAIAGTPDMRQVSAAILDGEIQKQSAVDVAKFLRTCLAAAAVANARMIEAEVNPERGIGWFIQPPNEPERAGSEQVRPPGAPSLRQPSKPNGPGTP